MRIMYALLLVFMFLVPVGLPAADDDWVKNLPVRPGSTPEVMKTQELFIHRKYDFKIIDKKAWLKGAAFMYFDDRKGSKFGSGSGSDVEVTFDAIDDAGFAQCRSILEKDLPANMQLNIAGQGRYTHLKKPDEDDSQVEVSCKNAKSDASSVSTGKGNAAEQDSTAQVASRNKLSCEQKRIFSKRRSHDVLWVFELFHLSQCTLAPEEIRHPRLRDALH